MTENAKAEIKNKNEIKKNYNQGILIVEGCSAVIMQNTISQNLKANIAYGGQGSKDTRVEFNIITGSVAEGIFVVEGNENTLIRENEVTQNKDGIVLYNSNGRVKDNKINVGFKFINRTIKGQEFYEGVRQTQKL